MVTTTTHVREFREQGFTVFRRFFPKEAMNELLDEVQSRMGDADTQDGLTDGGLVFNANVFKGSAKFQAFISQQRIIDLLQPLAGGDLWVRWDQAVTKRPGAGVFRWHQDNGYNNLLTEHYQLWIALTETRNQNGALWLAPGSHKRGLLPHAKVSGVQIEVQAEVGESICVDANIGDVILFSSLMLHRTGPNDADTTRVAYVAEYMPCRDYDWGLPGPYFVAARNGVSDPHFVSRQPGALRPVNHLMYWRPKARAFVASVKQPLRALKRALVGPVRVG